jgi:crossover junction endodeoxyribonuclease RuvC
VSLGRILGVDPGSLRTGWGVIEGPAARPRLVDSGVIRLGGRGTFAQRLHRLRSEFEELLGLLAPSAAAVEMPFHGTNARAALQLAHARGVLLAALAGAGVPVTEYSPAAIKSAVAGTGRAQKDQVQAMVGRLLGLPALAGPADRADALAVALCHLACAGHARAVASTSRPHGRRGPPVRSPR